MDGDRAAREPAPDAVRRVPTGSPGDHERAAAGSPAHLPAVLARFAHRAPQPPGGKPAWVWPLIGQPQQQSCAALLTDGLAGSLTTTGRLARLLADGNSPAASAAALTWAIDPSLVASAKTMTSGYQVGGTDTCAGAASRRASAAARSWLAQLNLVTARQDFFTTPYADVDSSALTHAGLDDNLARAYDLGAGTAQKLLGSVQRRAGSPPGQMAWPAAGDCRLPGAQQPGRQRDRHGHPEQQPDAAEDPGRLHAQRDHYHAEWRGERGHARGPGRQHAQPAAGRRADRGRQPARGRVIRGRAALLAETAMIAAEQLPGLPGPWWSPRRAPWNPARGLASQLLAETVQAPWLRPASLASLVTAGPGAGQVTRTRATAAGDRPRGTAQVAAAQAQGRGERDPAAGQRPGPAASYLGSAVATVESSAWRGTRRSPGPCSRITGYLTAQWRQVRIVGTGQDAADRKVRLGPGVHQ